MGVILRQVRVSYCWKQHIPGDRYILQLCHTWRIGPGSVKNAQTAFWRKLFLQSQIWQQVAEASFNSCNGWKRLIAFQRRMLVIQSNRKRIIPVAHAITDTTILGIVCIIQFVRKAVVENRILALRIVEVESLLVCLID